MLKPIEVSQDIRSKLSKKLDFKLIKKRKSAGTELSYISANTCIDILNNAFGHNWSMRIVEHWIEPGYDQIIKEQTDYNTKQKKWPKGIVPEKDQIQIAADGTKYISIPQSPSAWCIVELSVVLTDDKTGEKIVITKQGFGSQAITGNQSNQSQNGYKGAQSDALKKAATLLGIALELYRDKNESAFFDEIIDDLNTVWTSEVIEKNKELWTEYKSLLEEFGWDDKDISYFVQQVTNDEYDDVYKMPVEYMLDLISTIKNYDDESEGDEE